MKTLTDFKKKLSIGTKLQVTFHGKPLVVYGNTGTTTFTVPQPQERIVVKIQSNAVAFHKPNSKELAWLYYPKASEFKVQDGKALFFNELGQHMLTYEFI